MCRRLGLLRLVTHRVVDRKHDHAKQQSDSRDDGHNSASLDRFWRARGGIDLGVVNNFERCFVEVAMFVRVGVEEETLGATFHDVQNLKGFFKMRPVFLRIEPTFESSFFVSSAGFG